MIAFCTTYIYFRLTEISKESQDLIKGLFELQADARYTATQVRHKIEAIFASKPIPQTTDQLVPFLPTKKIQNIIAQPVS